MKSLKEMTERERMKWWVDNWKVTGPLLEQIKRDELRALTEEQALKDANNLQLAYDQLADKGLPPDSSGLVEQQRIFAKWKR